ncbi:U1 small nuclear ribonucleoprotein A-like [Symsagittifera roscoffensis]|uniref:U1 small nuclear ribonucleoprotein A-like n=1 Tax=Symsagittifera roscoffensis TaxID=84072 RepID=UPI00307C61FC
MADIRPNHTLYIKNLNDKLTKLEVKKQLYYLFSQYGAILDIVALKTQKMRGQAFVVFSEIPDATKALRALQGFPFLDKAIRLQYAKTDSEVIVSKKGASGKKADKKKTTAKKKVTPAGGPLIVQEGESADKVLFITNLPEEANEVMITMLFQQFTGFVTTRLLPGKRGMAFVDFDNENNASLAKDSLQGFKISPTNAMKIAFASK